MQLMHLCLELGMLGVNACLLLLLLQETLLLLHLCACVRACVRVCARLRKPHI